MTCRKKVMAIVSVWRHCFGSDMEKAVVVTPDVSWTWDCSQALPPAVVGGSARAALTSQLNWTSSTGRNFRELGTALSTSEALGQAVNRAWKKFDYNHVGLSYRVLTLVSFKAILSYSKKHTFLTKLWSNFQDNYCIKDKLNMTFLLSKSFSYISVSWDSHINYCKCHLLPLSETWFFHPLSSNNWNNEKL